MLSYLQIVMSVFTRFVAIITQLRNYAYAQILDIARAANHTPDTRRIDMPILCLVVLKYSLNLSFALVFSHLLSFSCVPGVDTT